MTDSELHEWQSRDLNKLTGMLKNPSLQMRVRSYKDANEPESLYSIIEEFALPWGSADFLEHYIATGEIKAELLKPSLLIESEPDGTVEPSPIAPEFAKWILDRSRKNFKQPEVRLILGPDTTRREVDAFLDLYWKTAVKPKLKLLAGASKQYRTATKADRDAEIINLTNDGLSRKEIADRIWDKYGDPFTPEDVSKVLNRKHLK